MRRIEVLAVEDSSTDLFWLKNVLNQIGLPHALSVADNGESAVKFLLKQQEFAQAPTPDLILLDVHLPIMTGIEVLRQVPHAEKLPICVLTSSDAERETFRKEYGIEGLSYLIKPVTPASLLDCFRCYPHLRPLAEELSGASHNLHRF